MSSLEKAEIAQDILAIMLGGEPAARQVRPDWPQSTFVPNRAVWASYVGGYETAAGSIRVYREGDRLLSVGDGVEIEFVPLSDSQFVMLSDVSTLDEQPVEFQSQPNGSVVLLFFGAPLAIKN